MTETFKKIFLTKISNKGSQMPYLNLKDESVRVKKTAEEVLISGGTFMPMIGIFKEGEYKGAIVLREPTEEDEVLREYEKSQIFAEGCLLISALHGDEVVVSFSTDVGFIDSDASEMPAINVMHATDDFAEAIFMPFEVDEEGRFKAWLLEGDAPGEIKPEFLSHNMIATLAHNMVNHYHQSRPETMMRTLAKSGHVITLADDRQFLPTDFSGTIEPSAELNKMLREG